MRRRDFITVLGGTMAVAARAQQPAMPVIGHLGVAPLAGRLRAFLQGLSEIGYVEGRNVTIEYRWAEDQIERLAALAADLVERRVSVITVNGNAPALAVKAATATIPIVFSVGSDPVGLGLVASFNRPGGNATGVALFANALEPKCLELLSELVPKAAMMAVLLNPSGQDGDRERQAIRAAASGIGRQLIVVTAISEREIDRAFATLVEKRVGGLIVSPDGLFTNRRDQIVALAARHVVPTIYQWREYAVAGGLMSYGTSLPDASRQMGVYVGRILKGEKPADLPVVQPTKFEFVINLKTAKPLGLDIPPTLLARADEVIE